MGWVLIKNRTALPISLFSSFTQEIIACAIDVKLIEEVSLYGFFAIRHMPLAVSLLLDDPCLLPSAACYLLSAICYTL